MSSHFFAVLLIAFATAGCAIMARALPWPKEWTTHKPLACPACMSGWSAFIVLFLNRNDLIVSWTFEEAAMAWMISVAVSAPIFSYVYPPPLELPGES